MHRLDHGDFGPFHRRPRFVAGLAALAAWVTVTAACLARPGVPPEPPLADESQPSDRPDKHFPPHIVWSQFSRAFKKMPTDQLTVMTQGRGADLWVGTVDAGLLRIRGESVKHFPPEDEGLPRSPISALTVDEDGGVWVGTAGRGLAHWSKETWHVADVRDGLPSNRVTSLLRREKRLFVGTDSGLLEWSQENRPGRGWGVRDGLWSAEVTAMAARGDGQLWVGTRLGLGTLDPNGESERVPAAGPPWMTALLQIDKLELFGMPAIVTGSPAGIVIRKADDPEVLLARLGVEDGLPDGRVSALAAPPGLVRFFWVGTDGGGLAQVEVRKDRQDRPYFEVRAIAPGPGSYPDGRIASLVADTDRIWLASSNGGLSAGTLQREPQDTSATASAGAGGTASAGADGTVPAGVAGQPGAAPGAGPGGGPGDIRSIDPTHPNTCTTAGRLNWNIVLMAPGWRVASMAQSHGQLWVGFVDRGAAAARPPACEWVFYPKVTDGKGGSRLYVHPQPTSVASEYAEAGLGGGCVGDIAVDSDASIWFATYDMGLSRREKNEFLPMGAGQGIPTRQVRRLHADWPTGDLYAIATNDQGFTYDDPEGGPDKLRPRDLVFRRSGGEWKILPLAPGYAVKELEFTSIYPLRRDGKLYLGTTRGLHEYDGRAVKRSNKRMATIDLRTGKRVAMDDRSQQELAETAVSSLFEVPPGQLGICTDKGLFLDDGTAAARVPGTEGYVTWAGSYDHDTRMIYFLGSRAPRYTAATVPVRKGQLWRYQPEKGVLKALVSETNCYVVTPTSVWYSRHPVIGEIKPKPIR